MHPTVRIFSARAHTPLIRFLGKRTWSGSETPHAHPAAPAELQNKNYSEFSTSPASSSNSVPSSSKNVFREFWEAPERLWKKEIDEREIDAVLSGGASLR
ncbi:hypothetical protein Moror_10784 [Moniliophthora roreri MCA 2997]|uniref:Uncharacterized protein n=2 Tax=Moniliophthora roreri TaxID=221103 RepID=V2WMF5_MONRO|nr:hypothetical protein Moror_10784 [Moniliophthora roreri MCA 2997]KAI3616481.1 hypothetical protein WG66_011531 [Moniliophthora roreri]